MYLPWVRCRHQVEVDLVAQPPLRPGIEAIADDQHLELQLRVERRSTRLAVIETQELPEFR